VNGYDGRPTESQTNRMNVLARDLEAAYATFGATADKGVAALNPPLQSRKLGALTRLTAEEWAKRQKP
jgi:hypothetical protein